MRASENKHFKPVGRKDGQGTVTSSNTYQFLDRVPESGTYYYKIRQTDFDGSTSCSQIQPISIGNSEEFKIEQVKMSSSGMKISVESGSYQDLVLQVFNSYGQRLDQRSFSVGEDVQTLQFSLPDRPQQFYYLSIVNENSGEKVASQKLFPMK